MWGKITSQSVHWAYPTLPMSDEEAVLAYSKLAIIQISRS